MSSEEGKVRDKVRDIAAVILTYNRHPQANYLRDTLENLHRAGALTSKRLHSLKVVCPHKVFASSEVASSKLAGHVPYIPGGHPANLNAAITLETGYKAGTEWVLFLEDDIDVIDDFFDSVGAWLDEVATDKVDIYPLGANYPNVNPRTNPLSAISSNTSEVFWKYPTNKFYGTQAVAFRSSSVPALVERIRRDTFEPVEQTLSDGTQQIVRGSGYDLMMARWHNENRVPWLLTPVPSFVQHIGVTSYLTPRNTPHTFPSWPGHDWSFLKSKEVTHV